MDMMKFNKCTDRVARLRELVLGPPEVCADRAKYLTESFMQTEGEPQVIRRAKGMVHVLENMRIRIDDGELIVGNSSSKHRGALLIPELQWKWYLDEIDLLSERQWDRCAPIGEEERKIMQEYLPYWDGKTPQDEWVRRVDRVALMNQDRAIFMAIAGQATHLAHTAVDYEKAIGVGFEAMKKQIDEEIAKTDPANQEKITYITASKIALDGAIRFANRYAELADKMADEEKDETRRAELRQIAVNCRRVPAYPAESFQQALQAMWFVNLCLRIEAPALGITFGRPDQYLYPYFRKDIDSGVLTPAQAEELVALALVKMNDMAMIIPTAHVETLGGFATMAGITLGGATPDGKPATNELSWLILEAETQVGLTVDEVIIRIGDETPDDFIIRACAANKLLRGKLKFASDYTVLKQFEKEGRPVEAARDYTISGCFTPAIPKRYFDTTACNINGAIMLEFALNNGVSRITGEKWGIETGDPRKFSSFEEVLEAFRKQIEAAIVPGVKNNTLLREVYAKYVPQPFHSILFDGCLEKGVDVCDGLTYPFSNEGYGLCGLVDIADSLAALKKAVFEDKVCTMAELIDALDKNFEGYEELRQYLIKVPKYGNGIDYVDDMANVVLDMFYNELAKHKGYKGDNLALAAATGTNHLMFGRLQGATPDGRLAGEPLAEGGVSPHQGRNKTGITGTFNSVSHLNHVELPGGSVFNMRINPSALRDEARLARFAALLRTYCKRGGYHAQFNIVDSETLRQAQKEPEKYKDLVVRVATYSALFTELSTALQNDIIERSEFEDL